MIRRAAACLALAAALLAPGAAVRAQGVFPLPEKHDAVNFEFRPGGSGELLLLTRDEDGKAEVIVFAATPDGAGAARHRFAGNFAAVAFLGPDRVLTLDKSGKIELRALDGAAPRPFAQVPPLGEFDLSPGLNVAPDGRLVAVRTRSQPIRLALSRDGTALAIGYMGMPGGGADLREVTAAGLGAPRRVAGPIGHAEPADIAGFGPGFVFANADRHRLRFLKPDGTSWRADAGIATPRLLAVSAAGDRLAVLAEEGLVLFDAAGERVAPRPFADFGVPTDAALLRDGTTLAALSPTGTLRFWTLAGGEARPPLQLWDEAEAATIYGTGRLLIGPDRAALAVATPVDTLRLLDADGSPRGAPIKLPAPGPQSVYALNSVALGPDRIALPTPDHRALIQRDFAGAVTGARIGPHRFAVMATAYAPDGGRIVTCDGEFLRLWGTASGEKLAERRAGRLDGLERAIRVTFAPDGRSVAIHGAGLDDTAHAIWELAAADSFALERRPGRFLRFLPDGAIASQDGERLVVAGPDGARRSETRLAAGAHVVALSDDARRMTVLKRGVARVVER
jgi:hypothetical protein